MNEAIDPQLHSILVSKFRDALDTRSFHEYFTFVDEQIRSQFLPDNYMSENNGEFMGKFFEYWQTEKRNAISFMTHPGISSIPKSRRQNICNAIAQIAATDEINLRLVCLLKNSIEYLLFNACRYTGNASVVRVLAELGANINSLDNGWTPLTLALQNGHLEVGDALLNKGVDVNLPTKMGSTPLIIAASKGHTEIALRLLKNGADINAVDDDGRTALYWALSNGHSEAARALVEKGADVKKATITYRQTSLIIAVSNGDVDAIRMLLNAGANINQINLFNHTPLSIASYYGHMEAVRLLLEKGAEISYSEKLCAEKNPEIHALLKQTKIERAEKAKRKQEATTLLALGKYKRGIFASEKLEQLSKDKVELIGRMIKASSSAAA